MTLVVLLWPASASAFPAHLRKLEAQYNIQGAPNASCKLCHTSGGGSPRNAFGIAFQLGGANASALTRMEGEDSDGDGISNLQELLAGTFPGDAGSTPSQRDIERALERAKEGDEADEVALPEVDAEAGEFVLLIPPEGLGRAAAKGGGGLDINITLGGALDFRIAVPTNTRSSDVRAVDAFVHVAELAIQTEINERVTLLGELLLPLNFNRPIVNQFLGNDHGFFYVTVRDLPYDGGSLWLGRYRLPYGIDAVLDGATNPLPTPVYRSLGRVADLALMLKGYSGALEYSFAVTDGVGLLPGAEREPVTTGEPLNDWPVFGRLALDLAPLLPGLHMGFSGYSGRARRDPPVGVPILQLPNDRIVRKLRGALSAWYLAGRVGLFAELEGGQDILAGGDVAAARVAEQSPNLSAWSVLSVYGRARVNLTEALSIEALGHYYDPNFRRENATGRSEAELMLGFGVKHAFGEQVHARLTWLGWLLDNADRVDSATAQIILEF